MILHTLNASPSSSAFADCLRVVHAGDAVVLMGDGIYVALAGTRAWGEIQATGVEVYLLRCDAVAAGATALAGAAKLIEMDDFVALTERYPRQQAWY